MGFLNGDTYMSAETNRQFSVNTDNIVCPKRLSAYHGADTATLELSKVQP